MNGLEQIQESIKNFIFEKKQVQQQIKEIEEKRTKLAQERNEKKKINANNVEVYELGKEITELGNQSQELQNKLDFQIHTVKEQVSFNIDNLIAEGIRKIRKLNEGIQEIQEKISKQEERKAKYQLQKQEFFARFGRMPELSENAQKEIELQKEENKISVSKIQELQSNIIELQEEIAELARIKRNLKNGSWNSVIVEKATQQEEVNIQEDISESSEEIYIEEIQAEEIETIEELHVEEFAPIEELYIEEFEPIEELYVEEFKEEIQEQVAKPVEAIQEENKIEEIEELAKSIVEEIVAEQTKNIDIQEDNIEFESAIEETSDDILTFEEKTEMKEKIKIPLFGQKATISNIIVKFEDTELVYKAQMSDENEIKIYPSKIGAGNVLLRDKQNRAECKEILINYAIAEYRTLDKKIINKIDPLICELLIECAQKYNYNAQELIYNYAMTFSKKEESDSENVPEITYNLSYIENSSLNSKEKTILNKICKNARKSNKVDIIESFSGFKKIKYVFKRIFAINNIKVLPEAKY